MTQIYNSKFKDRELLLEFRALSDRQTKITARAPRSFNGKIQNSNKER